MTIYLFGLAVGLLIGYWAGEFIGWARGYKLGSSDECSRWVEIINEVSPSEFAKIELARIEAGE